MEVTTFLQHGAQRPGVSEQWTPCFPTCHQHCVSLTMTGRGVTPGESLVSLGAQRSFSKRKARAQHVPRSSFGDKQGQFNICPRGTRKQASECPPPPPRSQGTGIPGLGRWWRLVESAQAPQALPPLLLTSRLIPSSPAGAASFIQRPAECSGCGSRR